jgi:hypothetical protein
MASPQIDRLEVIAGETDLQSPHFDGGKMEETLFDKPHPLAGKFVTLELKGMHPQLEGKEKYRIEDWWIRVAGKSWMDCVGNPACLLYAMHSAYAKLPDDDYVVYGKVGPFGHLIHITELGEVTE